MGLYGSAVLLLALLAMSIAFVTSAISHDQSHGQRSDAEGREMFESWVIKHGKVYSTLAEKERRFGIFKANIHYIDEHNAENGSYRLGLNRFADLTKEEFQSMHGGAHRAEGRRMTENPVSRRNMRKLGDEPDPQPAVDWRERGAVTSVKDQGPCAGASWAFSGIAALEGLNKIRSGELIDLSEQELVDCVYPYGLGCEVGIGSITNAFQYMKDNGGISSEEAYPYGGIAGVCQHDKPKVVQINGYFEVPEGDEKALQKAVAYQPVSAIVDVDVNFHLYQSGIYTGPCKANVGTQGVAIVGYGTENGVDYWILKNSWGIIDWGEGGYMRMQRNVGICGIANRASYPS